MDLNDIQEDLKNILAYFTIFQVGLYNIQVDLNNIQVDWNDIQVKLSKLK